METVFFFVMNFVFMGLYVKLLLGDPGFIEQNPNEWNLYLAALDKHNEPVPQFCLSCMVCMKCLCLHCNHFSRHANRSERNTAELVVVVLLVLVS
jgi:hypothetical protein